MSHLVDQIAAVVLIGSAVGFVIATIIMLIGLMLAGMLRR